MVLLNMALGASISEDQGQNICLPSRAQGFPGGSDTKESACNAGDMSLIPGLGRFPGERIGNPLQYFWLETPMNRGAWWAIVHGVTKQSDTTWLLKKNKNNEFSWALEDSVSCCRSQNLLFSD